MRPRSVATLIALAALAPACGDGPTEVTLSLVQVKGTVTSTADDQPIPGVRVVLTFPEGNTRGTSAPSVTDSLGHYAVSQTDVRCSPGALSLAVAFPPGYQFPADIAPVSLACSEGLQVVDFQLEPVGSVAGSQ